MATDLPHQCHGSVLPTSLVGLGFPSASFPDKSAAHSARPRLPSVLQDAGWHPSLHALLTDTASIIYSAWHAPQPARGLFLLAPPTRCLVPSSAHTLTRVCLPLVFLHLAAPMHRLPLGRFIRRGDTTAAGGGLSLMMQLGRRAGWAGCGPVGMDEHARDGVNTLQGPRRPGGSGGSHTVHGRCGIRWDVGELPSSPHIWVWLLLPSGSLSHKRTGSISTVEVGWLIHRFQPP
jgi:hypothetical protein